MSALQTIITLAPKLTPLVYDVLERDGNHEYGLKFPADYGIIRTGHFPAFDYEDDVLLVTKADECRSRWIIKAFEPGQGLFDGTSLLPDKGKFGFLDFDALFKAACFHDVVYKRADDISKATGVPVKCILAFADDMLAILAEGYGAKKTMTRPIHWLTRVGGYLYHQVKKLLALTAILALTQGCFSILTEMEGEVPDIVWTGPVYTNVETNSVPPSTTPTVTIPEAQEPTPQPPEPAEPQPTVSLDWRYGGFNGAKAKVDSSVSLSSVKVKGDTITYSWQGKVPSSWARRHDEKGELLVFAVFVKRDGAWVGGKVDWTDESRTSRVVENIRHNYNGWTPSLWDSAREIGICVASADGKYRSELATARK